MEKKYYPIIAVGGGPAGISLAVECIEMGISKDDILVLEKGEAIIKAVQQFYPDKKMTLANYKNLPTEISGHIPKFPDLTKAETIVYFQEILDRYQIQYRLNSEVFKVIPRADGLVSVWVNQQELTADFVAIGIGILGRPKKPDYKLPLKLRDQILFDLTAVPVTSGKILVVGGGDTSSEYCQILVEENCQVSLCYRGLDFHRMMDVNREAVEKLSQAKRLRVLTRTDIENIEDSNGKPKVFFKGELSPEEFDRVVFSIGGTTPVNFLKTAGIEFDDKAWPKLGPEGQTNVSGVYLTGDLAVSKTGGSIITAYNSCYRTAKKISEQIAARQSSRTL